MMSLGVGRTKDEVVCILARQFTKVAAMADVLSHRLAPLLMLCIMRIVAVLIIRRSCDEFLHIWLKSWLSACWQGESVDLQPSRMFTLFSIPTLSEPHKLWFQKNIKSYKLECYWLKFVISVDNTPTFWPNSVCGWAWHEPIGWETLWPKLFMPKYVIIWYTNANGAYVVTVFKCPQWPAT